ncbi:thioredoxin family protein [Mucilaginibacter sp. AW1-3]
MKKLFFLIVLSLFIVATYAQDKGIRFEKGMTWKQIKEKAQKEHKYIFVDCYATWCAPCKLMDANVYVNDTVGAVVNKDFISFKLQCDITKNDNDYIKSMYADARELVQSQKIESFPTFLFFSPSGEIVHKAVGYQLPGKFIQLIKEAKDPAKQYYPQLKKYQEGKLGPAEIPAFAQMARRFDKASYPKIIQEYIENYLDKLPENEFFKQENLDQLSKFRVGLQTADLSFKRLFGQSANADKIMKEKGFAFSIVNDVIYAEQITPEVKTAKTAQTAPDWEVLKKRLADKYGMIHGAEAVARAKLHWYEEAKDSLRTCAAAIERVELNFADSATTGAYNENQLNQYAWNVFQMSKDPAQLQSAVTWADIVLSEMDDTSLYDGVCKGMVLDTKANLLYKLGKRQEALQLEENALKLANLAKDFDPRQIADMQKNLEKIKTGRPTW